MHRLIAVGSFFVLSGFCWSGPAHAATKGGAPLAMSVTQEASEEQRIADILERYAPLAGYLSAVAGTQPVSSPPASRAWPDVESQ